MNYSFEFFLNNEKWSNLHDHLSNFNSKLEENISRQDTDKTRATVRKRLLDKNVIRKANPDLLVQMKKELLDGNVVAVDGTCTDYDLLTVGFQARIGIIAINYKNIKTGYTIYISDPFIPYDKHDYEEIIEYALQKKTGRVGISGLHVRAIMLYKERDFILDRPEKYKMVQGDIFPYELKTGQGRLRGLNACLSLGRKILNTDNIIATQTTTSNPVYRILGHALESGEYIEINDYYEDLNAFLNGDGEEYSVPARFNDNDREAFRLFIEDAKKKFVVGLYKSQGSNRSYVFYAPKKNMETMVNLLFADSSFQPIRGFPLLLDYADAICSKLISSEDFRSQIEAKLARKKLLDFEKNEKSMRRR